MLSIEVFIEVTRILIFRSDFRPMLMYLCRVSFLTTLDIYKASVIEENTRRTYTKGDRFLILSEKSYCVFAP